MRSRVMWRRVLMGVAALMAGACEGNVRAASSDAMSPAMATAVEDSVRAMLEQYRRLGATAQWDSLALLYDDAPTFRWIENGKVVAHARADIRQGLGKIQPDMAVETTFDSLEVHALDPRVVSVQTMSRTQFVERSTRKVAFGFSVALTLVIVRRPEGWKIRQGHASGGRAG